MHFILKIIFAAALLTMGVSAMAKESVEAESQIAQNMEKLKACDDPDTAQYIGLAYATIRMAEVYEQEESVAEAYRHLVIYLGAFCSADRAYRELEKLRDYVRKTGKGSSRLYESWQNIVFYFFNESNPLRGMTEHQEMLKMADEQDDDYGRACAHASLGSISEYAYETGIEHFSYAIDYLVKCGRKDKLYFIYYQMAMLAHDNKRFTEALHYLDKMDGVEVKPDIFPNMLELYGYPIRLVLMFELDDEEGAAPIYKSMKKMWDEGKVNVQFAGQFAMAMCIYLCKWGDINQAAKFLPYINTPYEGLETKAYYHKQRGDYKRALELTERLDTLKQMKTLEEQRAKVINANAFYKNKELTAKNYALEMINAKIRVVILAIVLAFVIAAAAGITFTIRRHNKRLKAERDKTEEQRCIAECERAKAEHLNEMKAAFINNMAHEVRTPLNSIVGFNDMLNNSGLEFSDEERHAMMSQINDMAGQLTSLLDNVIFMSRLDSKDITPCITMLPLAEVLAEALGVTADKVKDGVQLDVEEALATTLTVHADHDLLFRAITAVMDNAVKFTDSGTISLSLSPSAQSQAQIVLTNSSAPIPADAAERIFDRFEKLGRFDAGFGLGLSIARECLAIMNGTIRVDTTYTAGVRFIIEI